MAQNEAAHAEDLAQQAFKKKYGNLKPDALYKECRDGLTKIHPGFAHTNTWEHAQIDRCRGKFPDEVVAFFHEELGRQTADYERPVIPPERAYQAAWEAYTDARDRLLAAKPTSTAGAVALLAYASGHVEIIDQLTNCDDGEMLGEFLSSVAKSLELQMA